MNNINCPTLKMEDFYESMIENIIRKKDNQDLKPIYLEILPHLVEIERNYLKLANDDSLHLFSKNSLGHDLLDTKDMKFLYTKFRKEVCYYSEIKKLAEHGVCPYCERGDVSQLDHYLSQDKHPECVIFPINLVPTCSECNRKKSNNENQIIHPYFDETNSYKWVKCTLKVLDGNLVAFCDVEIPSNAFSETLTSRILNTWRILDLQKMYVIWMSGIIVRKKANWSRIYEVTNKEGLVSAIHHEIETMNISIYSLNSYENIFYSSFLDFIENTDDFSFLDDTSELVIQ